MQIWSGPKYRDTVESEQKRIVPALLFCVFLDYTWLEWVYMKPVLL